MGVNKFACITMGMVVIFCSAIKAVCQDSSKQASCAKPVMLEMLPDGADGVRYRVDGHDVPHYPLNELARALNLCGTQRALYLLADGRVSLDKLPGAVMAKLQVENVRYFIVYPEPDRKVVEVKIVGYFSKLP